MDDGTPQKPQLEPFRDGTRDSLTPERWRQIKEVFGRVLDCDSNLRDTVLQEASGGDESLRAEVQSLLVAADVTSPATADMFLSVVSPSIPQLPSGTEDRMLGKRIGAYRLERRIGYGGMASVYLAARADDEYSKQVAIKLLRPDLDNAELLKRFRAERQTLARLDHPNIVKLLDGGSTAEGLPFLVMDYVAGSPIDEYCDAHKLTIERRLRLFCTVCEAVRCAHLSQVIHRDLKPSNILVTDDGIPKLLDFGIAKVLAPPDASQDSITLTATRHLTPAYASPEQVRGEPVSPATDVYSLGVVLYELLTGHRPYRLKQRTSAELERAICDQDPESPSTAIDRVENETLPDGTTTTRTVENIGRTREAGPAKLRRSLRGDLDNILLKALQKAPKRRYQTVEAFEEDIDRHLNHRPIIARPSTMAYRVSKIASRHYAEITLAGVFILTLLGALGIINWQQRKALEKARAEFGGDRLPGRTSVAVLGFQNLSKQSENSWISTAMSEMLQGELAAGGKLRTVPDEDVAHMKADLSLSETNSLSPQTLTRIRRYLRADYLITGSYFDIGSSPSGALRIDILLQDATRGETTASVTLSGSEAQLPSLAARAGTELREKLGAGTLPPGEAEKMKSFQPSNVESLRLYSEGLDKLRSSDPASGRRLLEQAVAIDPNSALAHSALAEALGLQGYDAKAAQEANQALALASGLPREQGLAIEGQVLRVTHQEAKEAEVYRTLFTFFPDNVDYGLRLVSALANGGKGSEAIAVIEELRKLPPTLSNDLRIDLAEALAAESIPDFKREEEIASHAMDKAKAEGRRDQEAHAWLTISKARLRLGEPEKAMDAAENAKRLWLTSGDRYGVAQCLNIIGWAKEDLGRRDEASKAYAESLQMFHELGSRWNEAVVLNNIAIILEQRGDIAGAKRNYEQSLAISRELVNQPKIAMTLANLAIVEMGSGDLSNSKAHIEEALAIDRARNDLTSLGGHLNTLYNLLQIQQDLPAAKAALKEAIRINRKIGQKYMLAIAVANLGEFYFERGEVKPATKCDLEALGLLSAIQDEADKGVVLRNMAEISLTAADLPAARKLNQEAMALYERLNSRSDVAAVQQSLAEVTLEEGNATAAEQLARQALDGFRGEKNSEGEADVDAMLSRVFRTQKRVQEAQASIAQARELISQSKNREKQILITIENAQVQAGLGKNAEALQMLSSALAEARKLELVPLQFEARLALGEVEVQSKHSSGRDHLAALAEEARRKGFLLIAHKASAVRKNQRHEG